MLEISSVPALRYFEGTDRSSPSDIREPDDRFGLVKDADVVPLLVRIGIAQPRPSKGRRFSTIELRGVQLFFGLMTTVRANRTNSTN